MDGIKPLVEQAQKEHPIPDGTGGGATKTNGYHEGYAQGKGGKDYGGQGGTGIENGSGNPSGGTGGLLTVYSDIISGEGKFKATGTNAKYSNYKGSGGSSGGGTINLFFGSEYLVEKSKIDVKGGARNGVWAAGPESGTTIYGGAGGTGSISVGTINTGTYTSTYKNY